MRIGILYHGSEFPPSERIEKMGKTLAAAGHEVFLICNNDGRHARREEQVGEVHVLRLAPTFSRKAWNQVLKFPAPFNPLWVAQTLSAIRRFRLDAIQVVDVPLSLAALYLGRLFRLPVVLDMWENYPEALRGWAQHSWKTRVFKNPNVARVVELHVVRRVDHIFTVVEEQSERLITDGVAPERISVVTNGVDMDLFLQAPAAGAPPMDAEPDAYKMLYVGELTIERGLDDVIRSMKYVAGEIPEARLYLAGTGSYEPQLRRIVEEEKAEPYVRFLGWLPFREIHAYVAKSDLCLVPHVYNDFINTTIPNKLFQYMAMGKPVLVSHARPLARIVGAADCGFVFESKNPEDAARQIRQAYRRRHDAAIGERGRRSAMAEYTWERAAAGVVACYRGLAGKKPAV
jgi:glycosyltransferase involved in cell wall biosynthesis